MAEKIKIIKPYPGFQEKFVRSNVDVVIGGGQLAGGKGLPLTSLVLTPYGWVKNRDLRVGDEVCTPFSGVKKVCGIFPLGKRKVYKIKTSDGRECEADFEHLWGVRTEKQRTKFHRTHKNSWLSMMTTGEMMQRLKDGKKLFLPLCNAIEFEEKEYVIHPYVLGFLLGDGCLTDSCLQGNTNIRISNPEDDIVNKVAKLINADRMWCDKKGVGKTIYTKEASSIIAYLRAVGLNTYSYNRFIPNEYLWGSIEQRKALLAGLFDTDGSIRKKNSYSITTTSKKLADDIVHLCRSLGYGTNISLDGRKDKYTSGECYEVSIYTDDIIFTSKKHQGRYDKFWEKESQYKHDRHHTRIISIEYSRRTECQCIMLDDDTDYHLYITDDWMVTHNTFAAILCLAEPSRDPKFRALFLRNNLDDLKSGGGILDSFKDCYGTAIKVTESGNPRVEFTESGSIVDVTHIADQDKKKLEQRFKGRQYDLIYYDELTGFTWETFAFLFSRNRGQAKWTGKVRATTNPKRNHWLRKFLDWYIMPNGEINPERNGIVRYFFNAGDTVDEVVWGDSKEEVYMKCKIQIDRFLAKFNGKTGKATYKNVIKSFTYYLGRTSENRSLGEGYAASVAAMGGKNADENSGNWNVDTETDDDAPIPPVLAGNVFMADEQRNGDRWVTADLADSGTDNFLALAWDGFHITDKLILCKTTPRENAQQLEMFAEKHGVSNSHIIYDAIRGKYINDYIPEAIPFESYRQPLGMYGRMAYNLKAECYMRLAEMIKRQGLSMADDVAYSIYKHQNLKESITIYNEFIEECAVVRFKDMPSGKKALMTKKEMNAKLGKGRSMDLLDPTAMRMYPVLMYPYGEELMRTAASGVDDVEDENAVNIYDETIWA